MNELLPEFGISFTLCCAPTAKARPRHMRTKGGVSIAYKGERQKANEAALELELARFRPEKPFCGGLELEFCAVMPLPKGISKSRRESLLLGYACHTSRPDLDNLAKQLMDAMTRLRFWNDDRQIARLVCEKRYGHAPGWLVRLGRICDER